MAALLVACRGTENISQSFTRCPFRCCPRTRRYILNVKCADYSPEHLWQMRIVTPPAQWRTIALPFSEMMLTRRGRVEMEQREINRDCINGVSNHYHIARALSCYGLVVCHTSHLLPVPFLLAFPFAVWRLARGRPQRPLPV